jgi:hypothetical protein
MQIVDEKPETIHLYVVREEEPKPSLLPIILSVVALSILVVSSALTPFQQPVTRMTLRVPAILLPLKTFTAQVAVIPTGIKTYPATTAHGVLTITNGSVIDQTIPAGFKLITDRGIEVVTNASVFVPSGSADGYGYATTAAHLSIAGMNLSTLAVNQTLGTSLYIRNLSPFTGGRPAHSVKYVTAQNKQTALITARNLLVAKTIGLHYPCGEDHSADAHKMVVTWRCQFVSYQLPSYMHVTGVRIIGKNLLLAVWFVARPRQWIVK